jgi:NTE family protein
VLEELRIPIDFVVGTSIGSIVGGLYASGMSPDHMSEVIGTIDWTTILSDVPPRSELSFRRKEDQWFNYALLELGLSSHGVQVPAGMSSGERLSFLFHSLTLHTTDVSTFDELAIPFRAMATDLNTGEPVVLDHGSLADAMRASMSIPAAVVPVEWDGRVLVDGGISRNLPIEEVREMGADVVIAVEVASPLSDVDLDRWSAFEVGTQTIEILMAENSGRSKATLGSDDILLVPEMADIELLSLDRMADAEEDGVTAAREAEDALSKLSVSEDAYARYLEGQRRDLVGPDTGFVIDSLHIAPGSRVPESVIRRRLDVEVGQELDVKALRKDIRRVYRIGEFDYVGFELRRSSGQNDLIIKTHEKPWGPGYLRFGLRIDAVPSGRTDFSLLLYYRRAFINRLGAEWVNRLNLGDQGLLESEFYQPLNQAGWLFVAPRIQIFNDKLSLFLPDGSRDVLSSDIGFGELDLGLQLGGLVELRVGARFGRQRSERRAQPEDRRYLDIGQWVGRLAIDGLDAVGFPSRGGHMVAQARLSRTYFGADTDHERLLGRGGVVGSLGRNRLAVTGEIGTSFSSDLPLSDWFPLGGFGRLSGLEPGERVGEGSTLAALFFYRQLSSLPEIMGRGVYLGLTGETGNTWPTLEIARLDEMLLAGSVFLGLDTNLGPFYAAAGFAEGGRSRFYFILGPLFPAFRG